MDWTSTLHRKPPARRYPFWARRDRRRAAQALGAGRRAEEVAAVERLPVQEVESLLHDHEFQELVRHYARIEALPRAVRIAELAEAALRMLELAVETGDLRVCMFVLHETRAGRDPGATVATHAVGRIEAEARRTAPPPERRPRRPAQPQPARPSGDWHHCAAVLPTAAAAERLAEQDLRNLEAAHRRTLRRLGRQLVAEAERAGTAEADEQLQLLVRQGRALARRFHDRPQESLGAAFRLEERRTAAKAARPIALWRPGRGPPERG